MNNERKEYLIMKKLNQKELKEIKNMISDYNEALKNGNETETLEDFINKIANETGIETKETKIEENKSPDNLNKLLQEIEEKLKNI